MLPDALQLPEVLLQDLHDDPVRGDLSLGHAHHILLLKHSRTTSTSRSGLGLNGLMLGA